MNREGEWEYDAPSVSYVGSNSFCPYSSERLSSMAKAPEQLSLNLHALEEAREQIVQLSKELDAERKALLRALPKSLGLASLDELIEELLKLEASSSSRSTRTSRKGVAHRDPRRKVSPDMERRIVAALKSGAKGAEVAAKFGISAPTVHKYKAKAGLVKVRGKRSKSR